MAKAGLGVRMEIRVLGCSGGIGGAARRTTAFLVDTDLLIDCGTGVGDLSFDALVQLDHVFLSHAHLDHIALLPMLVDSVMGERDRPLRVYGLPETLQALQQHVFNGAIWPDFTRLPTPDAPALKFVPVAHGQVLNLDGRLIQVLPARHSVPAAGYYLQANEVGFAFTGDTCACDELVAALNALPHLRYLVVETAFPEAMRARAEASSHLHPAALGAFLSALSVSPAVYVTHLKPNCEDAARAEISALGCGLPLRFIQPGDVFRLTVAGFAGET